MAVAAPAGSGEQRCGAAQSSGVAAQNDSVPVIENTSVSRRRSACCEQVPSGLRPATPHARSVPANVPEAWRKGPVPPWTFAVWLARTLIAQVCGLTEILGGLFV